MISNFQAKVLILTFLAFTIASARLRPMPGSVWSSSAEAVFISMHFWLFAIASPYVTLHNQKKTINITSNKMPHIY